MPEVAIRFRIRSPHRATRFDRTKYRRKLHRTTVAGTSPDSALARMPAAENVMGGA
jgi:hypothetical protein